MNQAKPAGRLTGPEVDQATHLQWRGLVFFCAF